MIIIIWPSKMNKKKYAEITEKKLTLKDNEILEIKTSVEGPLGFEDSKEYRLSVHTNGKLIVEIMTPGGWRILR